MLQRGEEHDATVSVDSARGFSRRFSPGAPVIRSRNANHYAAKSGRYKCEHKFQAIATNDGPIYNDLRHLHDAVRGSIYVTQLCRVALAQLFFGRDVDEKLNMRHRLSLVSGVTKRSFFNSHATF